MFLFAAASVPWSDYVTQHLPKAIPPAAELLAVQRDVYRQMASARQAVRNMSVELCEHAGNNVV